MALLEARTFGAHSAGATPINFTLLRHCRVSIKLDGDTELARSVDVMMVRTKRICNLIIKVYKLFSLFSSPCFLKETENMFSVVLSSYRNTRESLGELEKASEILACGSCSQSISRSPKLPFVFL